MHVRTDEQPQGSYQLKPRTTNLLPPLKLAALNARIAANTQRLLNTNTPTSQNRKPKSTRGPKPKTITNPFYGFIGRETQWGRYPKFAMDIIEGIARLDWHDQPIGTNGKSMPLSVRKLTLILENLPIFSNEAIEDLLQLRERHARRYLKAVQLIIPWMMKSRPSLLSQEMNGTPIKVLSRSIATTHDWQDCDDANIPSSEVLEKLHYDLRTLTQFNSIEEHEAELNNTQHQETTIKFPGRQEHPMKSKVMQMLREGAQVKPISRDTKVDPKTIRKWRAEAAERKTPQAA